MVFKPYIINYLLDGGRKAIAEWIYFQVHKKSHVTRQPVFFGNAEKGIQNF